MKSLLLAAGEGQRLRPLTEHLPKCLVPILGRPLLEYWLTLLAPGPGDRVLLNLHYRPEQVREFVAGSPYRDAVQLLSEERLLGTAGTLRSVAKELRQGTFLLAHADNLSIFNLVDLWSCHQRRPADCLVTMLVFATDRPHLCGIVETDTRGVVVGFHEKVADPPGNLANGAVFLMEPEVLDLLPPQATDLCRDLLPLLLARMQVYRGALYHRDIGNLESYALAQFEFGQLVGPLPALDLKHLFVKNLKEVPRSC